MKVERDIHFHMLEKKSGASRSAALLLAWAVTLSQYAGSNAVTLRTIKAHDVDANLSLKPTRLQILPKWNETVREQLVDIEKQMSNEHEAQSSDSDGLSGWENNSLLVIKSLDQDQSTNVTINGTNDKNDTSDQIYSAVVRCHLSGDSNQLEASFNTPTVAEWLRPRILYHFTHILQKIVTQSDLSLAEVAIISSEDVMLLGDWNRSCPQPVEACIHDLIRQQSLKQPDKIAVSAWDGEFTYRQLEDRSSRLAVHLSSLGVRTGAIVPLCFEKSRWVTVAILAVMKTGGAFVLLDPSHPIQRLQEISRQVKAELVVASPTTAEIAGTSASLTVAIGEGETAWRDNDGCWKASLVTPYDPLYVVFTSGSTGKPKGAVIEHVSWATNYGPMTRSIGMGPDSRVLQFSSYTFDVSISDMLSALLVGGCICIPSESDRRSNLAQAITQLRVNVAVLTPPVARLLRPEDVPTLETMVLCGEPMTSVEVATWSQKVHLKNMYGPVETTVLCTAQPIVNTTTSPRDIGKAIGGVSWVVDRNDHHKLAPIGALGELIIEGPIVARGYLHEPEKTAEVFIEPPSWLPHFRADKSRFYKTGDLVRYIAGGDLEYESRKDTQVKLRGQRIELGEVEYHVRQVLGVDVVAEVVGPQSNKVLAVFVAVGAGDEDGFLPPSAEFHEKKLRAESQLCERLPPYMVPAVFIPLSHIPLTINGKVDRRKLRDAATTLSNDELAIYTTFTTGGKRQPTTDLERIVLRLVATAVNRTVETLSIDDDFFQLGGDSITAMKFVGLARDEGMEITVADLTTQPKLAEFAAYIEQQKGKKAELAEVRRFSLMGMTDPEAFVRETIAPQLPLVSLDNILDVLPTTQMQGHFFGPCQYFLLHLDGEVDEVRLRAACQALVDHHTILRTVFLNHDNRLIQIVLNKMQVPFLRYESNGDISEFARLICQQDTMASVPLGVKPLQFTLVSSNGAKSTLIFRLSHSHYDGVALPLMYRDLAALYQGQAIAATDFSTYVYEALAQKTPAAFQTWKEILEDSSMTYAGHAQPSAEPGLSHTLRQLPSIVPPSGITIATLVKAGWALALAGHTQTSDVVFSQMVNGRGLALPGIDTLIGPCFSTIPVRAKPQSFWSGLDLLKSLQNQHMQTMRLDCIGIQDIVENSTPWAHDTVIGSIVVHQNIENLVQFTFEQGLTCTVEEFFLPWIPKEVVLYSIPTPIGLQLHLLTGVPIMAADAFDALLGKTSDYIIALASHPNEPLAELTK